LLTTTKVQILTPEELLQVLNRDLSMQLAREGSNAASGSAAKPSRKLSSKN
jgi:hypothetical protein